MINIKVVYLFIEEIIGSHERQLALERSLPRIGANQYGQEIDDLMQCICSTIGAVVVSVVIMRA
jgi:hypothetical protein